MSVSLSARDPDPRWRDAAACRGEPTAVFFADGVDGGGCTEPDPYGPAKAVCRRCPVRAECLRFALAANLAHGVWGGLTPQERRRAKRRGRP